MSRTGVPQQEDGKRRYNWPGFHATYRDEKIMIRSLHENEPACLGVAPRQQAVEVHTASKVARVELDGVVARVDVAVDERRNKVTESPVT